MSCGGVRAALVGVAIATFGMTWPTLLQAQSNKPGDVRMPPEGSSSTGSKITDPKARLREAGGTGAASDAQLLKQAVRGAESDAVPSRRFDADNSSCGFLTKPAVRPDGGGMNLHKGGQVLCHQDRLMHCLAWRWRDLGPCSGYGNFPQAWQFEGSDPPGTAQAGGSPDAGGSGSSQNPDDPQGPEGSGSGSGGGLIGTLPQSQQLQSEMDELREREAELNRQQGQQTDGGARGQPGAPKGQPGARRGPDPAQCAQLRQTITQADQAIKQFRDYSRSVRSDGQLSTDVRASVNTIQSQRNQAQTTLNQLGC